MRHSAAISHSRAFRIVMAVDTECSVLIAHSGEKTDGEDDRDDPAELMAL